MFSNPKLRREILADAELVTAFSPAQLTVAAASGKTPPTIPQTPAAYEMVSTIYSSDSGVSLAYLRAFRDLAAKAESSDVSAFFPIVNAFYHELMRSQLCPTPADINTVDDRAPDKLGWLIKQINYIIPLFRDLAADAVGSGDIPKIVHNNTTIDFLTEMQRQLIATPGMVYYHNLVQPIAENWSELCHNSYPFRLLAAIADLADIFSSAISRYELYLAIVAVYDADDADDSPRPPQST